MRKRGAPFEAVFDGGKVPELKLNGNDPLFLLIVQDYRRRVGATLGLEPADRQAWLGELDMLERRGRAWQNERGIGKKTLDLQERGWKKVAE